MKRTTDLCAVCKQPRGGKPTWPVMGGWMHCACQEAHARWLAEYTERAIAECRHSRRPLLADPTPTAAREWDGRTYGGTQ